MILNSIDIVNWKCFDHKKMDFDRFTLLNWKNGEGKSSLIQAIILCLFDKRPDNLDFESLVDTTKPTKITLNFTHNAHVYIVEREVGKTSAYRVYQDDELVANKREGCRKILSEIISESILTSMWGCAPLGQSTVLNTSYLFEILEPEFKEALDLKQYFQSNKTYNQKRKSNLEKAITNQTITQEEIDKVKAELDKLEEQIKQKAFVSDDEVIRAKKAKEDFAKYNELQAKLPETVPYDRELCIRLRGYGTKPEEWAEYFRKIHEELDKEKSKAVASPLTKYPKNVIASLIHESKCNDDTCILCGGKFVEPKIDYDTVDNAKIQRLEKILEDEKYSYADFFTSAKYWSLKKQMEALEYSKNIDFDAIINSYSKETNDLYARYNEIKAKHAAMDREMTQVKELLDATKEYDEAKTCILIIEEYIKKLKEFHAQKIVDKAAELVKEINPRYVDLFIDNGVYKAKIWDKDYLKLSTLAVQALSNGEKTCAALALILSIRDLFMPDLPLIMDESFVNLDANNLDAIKKIIREDKNQWIIVSHDERMLN